MKKFYIVGTILLLSAFFIFVFNACSKESIIQKRRLYFFTNHALGPQGHHLRIYKVNPDNSKKIVDSLLFYYVYGLNNPSCFKLEEGLANKATVFLEDTVGKTIKFYAEIGPVNNPIMTWEDAWTIDGNYDCNYYFLEE